VIEFRLEHESEQEEAGRKRVAKAEIPAVAFQAQAHLLSNAKNEFGSHPSRAS